MSANTCYHGFRLKINLTFSKIIIRGITRNNPSLIILTMLDTSTKFSFYALTVIITFESIDTYLNKEVGFA